MMRRLTILGLAALLSYPALADRTTGPTTHEGSTCIWVDQGTAERAARLLKTGDVLQYYCQQCQDRAATPIKVEKVEVRPVQGVEATPPWYQVNLNDQLLEMFYVYVRQSPNGPWTNLGRMFDCNPQLANDNPRTLPAQRVSRQAPSTRLPE